MKTHCFPRLSLFPLLLGGLLAAAPDGQCAEPPTKTPIASESTDASDYLLVIKDAMLQPRGSRKAIQPATLQNLVDVLREESRDVNIVITPGIADVTIENLKLRGASLEDELEALSVASGGQFVWEKRRPMPQASPVSTLVPLDPVTGLPGAATGSPVSPPGIPTPSETESTLYILREPAVPVESRRKVEAFNLSGYLKSSDKSVEQSLREIEEIVADTFEQVKGPQGAPDRPRFKFHAGANLLIVVGTQEAIEIARQVVNALPGQEPVGRVYGLPPGTGPAGGATYPGVVHDPFQPPRR